MKYAYRCGFAKHLVFCFVKNNVIGNCKKTSPNQLWNLNKTKKIKIP